MLIAEIYKGANTMAARIIEKSGARTGLKLLSVDEHRELCVSTGYTDVQVVEEIAKGWICCVGRKPRASSG